ncbi:MULTISPECIES: hypothetical protein [unclassified Microbulbifer]|uniref:hypothetical protein n=1 Tax=unclassified Microbulbifer TaxID=2619833 RepID=UPI0027E51B00|nr:MULTISPECIES: hypothetical protein [unclassified Microbulbifer]
MIKAMKKTGWTNFLASCLVISTLSGIGNALIMLRDEQWQAKALAACVFAYVICAATAAFSLFAGKGWAQRAVGVWAFALVLLIVPMQLWVTGAPALYVSVTVAIVGFLLFKTYKYVGRCASTH